MRFLPCFDGDFLHEAVLHADEEEIEFIGMRELCFEFEARFFFDAAFVERLAERIEVHEVIRQASIEANNHIKEGKANDLLDILLNSDIGLEKDELDGILEPSLYIGRCVSQVDNFNKMLKPYLKDLEKVEDNINL